MSTPGSNPANLFANPLMMQFFENFNAKKDFKAPPVTHEPTCGEKFKNYNQDDEENAKRAKKSKLSYSTENLLSDANCSTASEIKINSEPINTATIVKNEITSDSKDDVNRATKVETKEEIKRDIESTNEQTLTNVCAKVEKEEVEKLNNEEELNLSSTEDVNSNINLLIKNEQDSTANNEANNETPKDELKNNKDTEQTKASLESNNIKETNKDESNNRDESKLSEEEDKTTNSTTTTTTPNEETQSEEKEDKTSG